MRVWTVCEYKVQGEGLGPDGASVVGIVSGNIGVTFDMFWSYTHIPTGYRIMRSYGYMSHAVKIANELADLEGWDCSSVSEIGKNSALKSAVKAIIEREDMKDGE